MSESNILEELAESATKNQGGTNSIKGIKGLKVRDIRPPNITMRCIPDKAMAMSVVSQITIAGKSFIGGTMEITVRSNMTTESSLKEDPVKNITLEVMNCKVELMSCKTNLPSSMLPKIVNKFLNSTLVKVLPGMMCPAANKVVGHMEEKMKVVFEQYSVGEKGKCRYATNGEPEITGDYIGMPFKAIIETNDGEQIEILDDPPLSEDLPPKKEGSTEVIVPVNVLNGLMKLFQEDFSCDVTIAVVPTLTTDKLAEMMPSNTLILDVKTQAPDEEVLMGKLGKLAAMKV
ncbi:BPI fold-containing family B member 6 [Elgaria multicarinata webbii]|uniref:BPI fold-containing family B member 6 n=1 Tax=Elgaria multicarinata webbii TaxID=159646 RepID=UPI002FCD156D